MQRHGSLAFAGVLYRLLDGGVQILYAFVGIVVIFLAHHVGDEVEGKRRVNAEALASPETLPHSEVFREVVHSAESVIRFRFLTCAYGDRC